MGKAREPEEKASAPAERERGQNAGAPAASVRSRAKKGPKPSAKTPPRPKTQAAGPLSTQILLAFAFGVIFLVACVYAGLRTAQFEQSNFFFMRVVAAMAAAGFAAMLPGFIHIEMSLGVRSVLRAGGAVALFVVIWFFNPPNLVAPEPEKPHASTSAGAPAFPSAVVLSVATAPAERSSALGLGGNDADRGDVENGIWRGWTLHDRNGVRTIYVIMDTAALGPAVAGAIDQSDAPVSQDLLAHVAVVWAEMKKRAPAPVLEQTAVGPVKGQQIVEHVARESTREPHTLVWNYEIMLNGTGIGPKQPVVQRTDINTLGIGTQTALQAIDLHTRQEANRRKAAALKKVTE